MLVVALLTLFAQIPDPLSEFPSDGYALSRPGAPGLICVYGPQAHAVLTSGDSQAQAVAALATAGKGRVFAIAHNGYFNPTFFEEDDGMMMSSLHWLRGDASPGQVAFLRGGGMSLRKTLDAQGYSVVPMPATEFTSLQLLIVEGAGPLDPETLAAIHDWVLKGGTVLAAICPWGWQQIHASDGWDLTTDMAANQILAPFGLLFTDGYAGASADNEFLVNREACVGVNCQNLVAQIASGDLPPSLAPLESALRVLPTDDALLLPKLLPLLPELDAALAPTPEHPLKVKDAPLVRLSVVAVDRRLRDATPDAPMIAPGSSSFPGASPEGSRPVTRMIACDEKKLGWQSTGLYVDPGSVVKLEFPEGAESGWSYRIGAHADQLWHKDRWPRWPSVSTTGAVTSRITSPFGGLLYFQKEKAVAESVNIQVVGAIPAPFWQSGQTTQGMWKAMRDAPGPWAELRGQYLILTVPSASVRKLEDPASLMAYWDRVVETQFLFGAEEPPARPERFVADILISAGYMHSGYPIMMHLDVAESRDQGKKLAVLLDLEELKSKGNWGCFHELGHNRQKPSWTFDGTGEVTNNLFSLYSGQMMADIEPWENDWLQNQKKAGARYLQDGPDFSIWKREPGIALLCYAQIQKHFGWEPFRRTFASARALSSEEQPRNDDAKRSFWVRQMSLATQRDLRPFHAKWGWPLEDRLLADEELGAFESWMPDFEVLKK
ncbi:MAG: M60 family metallopeptidase [Planctomycetota bacterium]|nr:M60 family metallopeptidase [Planctomycetota bacterium]MDA1113983.1 M60 family metallopeptidase [Planctomycetota bacterium]